jgi:hypothetical protein
VCPNAFAKEKERECVCVLVCAACILFAAYVVVDKAAGAMRSKRTDIRMLTTYADEC